ncbi:MAG: hypothetical protein LBK61_02090 [Spirochaetaceae bacterium]|jgi:hypothetical protein|nr:hypothetical protein [Spirochaetaceae bacterium]
MALSVQSMKRDIISALKSGADNAADANKKFGDAILKNIVDNISIVYGWSAADPSSGAPDPAVSFSASVSGGGTLGPSANMNEMLVKLAVLIKGLLINAPSGFDVGPLAFNPAGVLSVTMAGEDTQDLAMEHFCEQIIASIVSGFPNPAPAAGKHGSFIGVTTGMAVS